MGFGLQIIVKGSDASTSTLPKLTVSPRGFNGDQLLGLYLYDDAGSLYKDVSGQGNNGTAYLDYAAPTKTLAGVNVASGDGHIFNTNITQPNEFTIIACLKHSVPLTDAGARNMLWMSDTLNNPPANAAGYFLADKRSGAGIRAAVNSAYNNHCVWDRSATQLASGNNQLVISAGDANIYQTVAFGVSVAGSQMYLRSASGGEFTRDDPEIAGAFSSDPTKKILLGLFALNTAKPSAGDIVGFAVYGKYMDGSQLAAAYAAFDAIKSQRGL